MLSIEHVSTRGKKLFELCYVSSPLHSDLHIQISFLVSFREDVERKFEGKLSKNMSGSLYEMVSRVMKALVNRKITVPGNFQGYAHKAHI